MRQIGGEGEKVQLNIKKERKKERKKKERKKEVMGRSQEDDVDTFFNIFIEIFFHLPLNGNEPGRKKDHLKHVMKTFKREE